MKIYYARQNIDGETYSQDSAALLSYKMCQELAGAQAIGPFLQGFARPVCDLSRGASEDDIVAAIAVTAAMG